MKYVTIDIETNGANPSEDDILLLSATKIVDGEIVNTFSKLVRPSREQTPEFELFTGITNEDLKDACDLSSVIKEFYDFSKDCTIVSYDEFEYDFLKGKGFEGENIIFLREFVKKLYPDFKKYIADSVIISIGAEKQLKEYLNNEMYYGNTRLFYSLKIAVILLNVMEQLEQK